MIGLNHCKLLAGDSDSRKKQGLSTKHNKRSRARVVLTSTMIHLISFVFFVSILLSIDSIAAQTQNQLGSKGTQQCTINNNFYAGPNKKVETVMFEMKKQLDEIQKELRNLTQKTKKENKTKGSYPDLFLILYHSILQMKLKNNVPTLSCCKIMILVNTDTSPLCHKGGCLLQKISKLALPLRKVLRFLIFYPFMIKYPKLFFTWLLPRLPKTHNPFSKWDKVYVILKR